MTDLFDSNFVYFAAYFLIALSIGQYIIVRAVVNWYAQFSKAFKRGYKRGLKPPAAGEVVDVQARVVTKRTVKQLETKVPVVKKPKPLTKQQQRQIEYANLQRSIDDGMHNLTSKWNRKSTAQ